MDLEPQVAKNTADIAAVTNTVTRLATVQENAEKQRIEDRDMLRKLVDRLTDVSEKMGVTVVMQANIERLVEMQGELKGDLRALRHDHNNTKQAAQGLPILGDKLSEAERRVAALNVRGDALEGRIAAVEAWRNKMDGAGGAIKTIGSAMWAVFGAGVLALGYFVLKLFLKGGPE